MTLNIFSKPQIASAYVRNRSQQDRPARRERSPAPEPPANMLNDGSVPVTGRP